MAAAIEAVMRRTTWFTDAVMEELARARQGDGPVPVDGGLGDMPPRAREVLALVCEGLDDAAIAATLGLSKNTARNHVAGLYKRTGSRNRTALVVSARERGVGGSVRPS